MDLDRILTAVNAYKHHVVVSQAIRKALDEISRL